MGAEESCHISIERAMEGGPVETCGIVGANARNGGREFWRAGGQEGKVAGRHDMNVGFARQAVRDTGVA